MNRMIKSSLLFLLVSNGAFASEYLLNNNNISLSFDDTHSAVLIKDKLSQSKLTQRVVLPDVAERRRYPHGRL